MAYEHLGDGALDYCPCRYGESKLLFRGPRKELTTDYLAMLGGSEVYGRYAEAALPDLLEQMIGRPVVNLGCINAGTDMAMQDETVTGICKNAAATIVQITGAQNMSNGFYSVHPRRNDRFLRPSPRLDELFGTLDLTEFHFTRHLLSYLSRRSPARFDQMKAEMKQAWIARMRKLIATVGGPVILLWMADHRPEDCTDEWSARDPLFIDRAMVDEVAADAIELVEIVAIAEEIEAGLPRMVFTPLEELSAREMLGPVVQANAARGLAEAVSRLPL